MSRVRNPARGKAQGSCGLGRRKSRSHSSILPRPGTTCSRRENPEAAVSGRDRLAERRSPGAATPQGIVNRVTRELLETILLHGKRRVVNDLPPAGPSIKNDRGGRFTQRQVGMSGWKHPERREQEPGCEGPNPRSAAGTKFPARPWLACGAGSGTSPNQENVITLIGDA